MITLIAILFSVLVYGEDLRTPVRQVRIEGISIEEGEKLARDLGISVGNPLNYRKVDEAIRTVSEKGRLSRVSVFLNDDGMVSLKVEPLRRIRQISFPHVDENVVTEIRGRFRLEEGDVADSLLIEKLKERISALYEERGYSFPKIDIRVTDIPESQEADIEVSVTANNPTIVNRILLLGVPPDEVSTLRTLVMLKKGEAYSKSLAQESAEKIQGYLRKNQYPTCKVEDVVPQFSPDRLSVDVSFNIRLGDRYQFLFKGNQVFTDLELREFFTEESLFQSEGVQKIASQIENRYRVVGYHFAEVKVKTTVLERGQLHQVLFVVDEGPKVIIDQLEVTASESWIRDSFKKFFYESAPGVLARGLFWQGGLAVAEEGVAREFQKLGYLHVSIAGPRLVFSEDRKGVLIQYDLDTGGQTKITEIEEEGMAGIPEEVRNSLISVKIGDALDRDEVEESRKRLQEYLLGEGYLDAQWGSEAKRIRVSSDGKKASILFEVKPGPQYTVGKIEIDGLKKTQTEVILREMKLSPGEKFDPRKLRKSEEDVSLLGLFSRVEMNSVPALDRPGVKDIKVTVRESKPGLGELGIGVNYENPRLRIKPFAGIAYRNLFGLDQTVSARFELPVPITLASRGVPFIEYGALFGYRAPYPFQLPFIYNSQLGVERYEVRTDGPVLQSRVRLDNRIEKKIANWTPYWRFFRYEFTNLENLSDLTATSERIGSTGIGTSLDLRDDIFNPRKGSFHMLDFEWGSPLLGSQSLPREIAFYMATFRNSLYVPLPSPFQLSFFGAVAYAHSNAGSSLPKTRLINDLSLGGPGSLRGYNLGELTAVPSNASLPLPASTGYYNGRAELEVYLFASLSAAAFFDTGRVLPELAMTDANPRRDAVGVGLRYKTPVGPIAIDFARRIDARPGEPTHVYPYFRVGTL